LENSILDCRLASSIRQQQQVDSITLLPVGNEQSFSPSSSSLSVCAGMRKVLPTKSPFMQRVKSSNAERIQVLIKAQV